MNNTEEPNVTKLDRNAMLFHREWLDDALKYCENEHDILMELLNILNYGLNDTLPQFQNKIEERLFDNRKSRIDFDYAEWQKKVYAGRNGGLKRACNQKVRKSEGKDIPSETPLTAPEETVSSNDSYNTVNGVNTATGSTEKSEEPFQACSCEKNVTESQADSSTPKQIQADSSISSDIEFEFDIVIDKEFKVVSVCLNENLNKPYPKNLKTELKELFNKNKTLTTDLICGSIKNYCFCVHNEWCYEDKELNSITALLTMKNHEKYYPDNFNPAEHVKSCFKDKTNEVFYAYKQASKRKKTEYEKELENIENTLKCPYCSGHLNEMYDDNNKQFQCSNCMKELTPFNDNGHLNFTYIKLTKFDPAAYLNTSVFDRPIIANVI